MAATMPQVLIEAKAAKPLVAQPTFPKFGKIELQETGQIVGTGWVPDLPDLRDYTENHPKVADLVEKLKIPKAREKKLTLVPKVDLRQFCSPIENQGMLGSCTANAAAGIVEYFEKRSFGTFVNGSRLFIYKTTRDLLGLVGDTGATIRSTMASLALFGVPPENYWPYTDRQQPGVPSERTFDEEPTAFTYELADNFESLNYICHDPFVPAVPPPTVLNNVKTYLAAGIPSIFGFYVFPSYNQGSVLGSFPYPTPTEKAIGAHAIVAVGYDDAMAITNKVSNKTTTGALLIRNSWGTAWGDAGYGWLPYDYVTGQFAHDFWSLLGMKWIQLGYFGLPV